MTPELIERIRSLRECGNTRRSHTIPYQGEYTVGKHSWDALTLLFCLYPGGKPSLDLVQAVLWHDCGERWMGDLPAPAKWYEPELGEPYERAEQRLLDMLEVPRVDGEDRIWLRAVDGLEFLLWCEDQRFLGNQNVNNAHDQIYDYLVEAAWLPDPVREFIATYETRRGRELSDVK